MAKFKVVNVDRVGTLPGGIGYPHDRAIVLDLDKTEPNILTGKPQAATVYRGTLAGANEFVKAGQ